MDMWTWRKEPVSAHLIFTQHFNRFTCPSVQNKTVCSPPPLSQCFSDYAPYKGCHFIIPLLLTWQSTWNPYSYENENERHLIGNALHWVDLQKVWIQRILKWKRAISRLHCLKIINGSSNPESFNEHLITEGIKEHHRVNRYAPIKEHNRCPISPYRNAFHW